jgi:hypothetical protein
MDHRERNRRGLGATGFGFLAPALLAALLAAPAARAQTWTEAGDAGELVGTAQSTSGSGSLTSINGVLSGHGDVDVYCVQLTSVPPSGLPLVWVSCASHADPTPYLFSAAGIGLDANMTCAGGLKETVAPNISLVPGQYYVAVAHGDWLPQSAGGAIWQMLFTGPMWPNGPGAGSPLTGWVGPLTFTAPAAYTLVLNPNYFVYCDTATPVESSTWGALKAQFGN